MKALNIGTKVRLKHRVWKGITGVFLKKYEYIPRGTVGTVKSRSRKQWRGQHRHTVDFGKYGIWELWQTDLSVLK